MDLEVFEHMDAPELRQYVEFLLGSYRVMDAFWYIYITERFDEPTADRLNEKVWEKVASFGAKDLLKRFAIQERGLRGFVKALKYWPWHILIGFQIYEKPDEVIIEIPKCDVQEARLRRGLPEYHCQEMHRREFVGFAQEVDSRIRVACDFAPPQPHPDNLFCRWRFTLSS